MDIQESCIVFDWGTRDLWSLVVAWNWFNWCIGLNYSVEDLNQEGDTEATLTINLLCLGIMISMA